MARLAVSFDRGLARAVRLAAGSEPISNWLADAAQRKLRAQGLSRVLDAWEAEHGAFSEAELRQAARKRRRKSR
ncbi:MAG TPA: hypothetical protein VJN18_31905 [Polyangiaceae bacterium]|nr:hypothetical protein [Polyangiaceae bacterium]